LARESNQLLLRGLSLVDAAGLVRDRTGIVSDDRFLATLHQTTGGNPLFLGGVLQTLMAEGKLERQGDLTAADLKLPINVRSAIARQLSRLSERTNSLLAAASALGVEFEFAPLERVAAVPAAEISDCLDEAVAAGMVAAGRYRITRAVQVHSRVDSSGDLRSNRRCRSFSTSPTDWRSVRGSLSRRSDSAPGRVGVSLSAWCATGQYPEGHRLFA